MPDTTVTSGFMTDDGTMITAASRGVTQSVVFTAAIAPANTGITLRRFFDHKDRGQTAEVSIDDQLVGVFRTPDANGALRWREQDFSIPESFTKGKSNVRIKLVVKSAVWNESSYQVLTATP